MVTPQRTSSKTRSRLAKALDRGDVRRRRRLYRHELAIVAQLKKKRKIGPIILKERDGRIKRRTPKSRTGRLARNRREVTREREMSGKKREKER